MQYIENKTFEEIKIGDSAELTRTLTARDIDIFAIMSGDVTRLMLIRNMPRRIFFIKSLRMGCGAAR